MYPSSYPIAWRQHHRLGPCDCLSCGRADRPAAAISMWTKIDGDRGDHPRRCMKAAGRDPKDFRIPAQRPARDCKSRQVRPLTGSVFPVPSRGVIFSDMDYDCADGSTRLGKERPTGFVTFAAVFWLAEATNAPMMWPEMLH